MLAPIVGHTTFSATEFLVPTFCYKLLAASGKIAGLELAEVAHRRKVLTGSFII
jgi:hypothetical protein